MAVARTICAFALANFALGQVHAAPVLDPLPHEIHPDDWPQPDYFTEALKLTRFHPDERWRALKLAAGLDPKVLVLPVQMEAFGWTPAFAAILGARLDHELAARNIDANRQTDLFDAEGPYARRFSDAEVAAFAAAHPKSQVLALYIGRDAAGKDFATLTLRRGGQLLRAHRTFAEVPQVAGALDAFSADFPAMLDELHLAAGKEKPAAEGLRRCDAGDWALADLKPGATRATRACRAAVIGALLPEFEYRTTYYPRPRTADKLPWLAEAWVEADALVPASSKAMRALVWSQLELTPSYDMVGTAVDVDDPVVRALARGLWAPMRTQRMPTVSRDAAQEDYAAAASSGLPPFVRAVLTEQAAIEQQFRPIDLCSLEMALPALRTPAQCAGMPPPTRRQPATQAEHALLEAWRIAAAYKDLRIEGVDRDIPERREAVLKAMSGRIAANPLIRMERFHSEHFNMETGSFEALARRAEAATTDFVQTTADLQRWTSLLANNMVSRGAWTTNEMLRDSPSIASVAMDDERLTDVLSLDGFMSRTFPPFMRTTYANKNLLRAGPLWNQALPARPAFAASFPQGGGPASAMARRASVPDPFAGNDWIPGWKDPKQMELAARNDPKDLEALSDLAVLRLKTGQSVAQARSLIDARPDDRRDEAAIGESHHWAIPGHVFFFAGELDAAGFYYGKVAKIGTYSSSDLQARVRLRLLAGDIPEALKASQERLDRYQDDFARRDIAGYEFMRGHAVPAWAVLTPRLSLSDQSELWAGVMVGQRMEGRSARSAHDWIVKSGYGHARIGGIDIGTLHALRFMTEDRVPNADDLALLAELRARQPGNSPSGGIADLQAMARLKQLASATRVTPADLQAVRDLLAHPSDWRTRGALKPLYAWAAWQAGGDKDQSLAYFRAANLTQDFDTLLAKGVLLGLDKQPDEALRYLRAARYDLVNTIGPLRRDARSAPYTAAFVSWLLYARTQDGRYRDEALLLAHAHERTFPFLAWPYALDALLSADGPARTTAACRAAFLDRSSLFLSISRLKPDPHGASCRKALW